ncbi:MAG: L,D-transpeptidase family protein [Pseudomonadota bacterium]|nr:L,D-transpeptidase family protein [Pseudomonadota bacterium]
MAAGLGWQAQAMPVGAPQPGLDMIMIDADAMPQEPEQAEDAVQIEDVTWSGAPVDLLKPMHHIYTDLRRQLIKYQNRWSSLPQVRVPHAGQALQFGVSNRHVLILRQRLGLGEGAFDPALRARVVAFQAAHGLSPTGTADGETLDALNRGAAYYERRLLLNMERARRLPTPGTVKKYILVDAGSARLWMYEDGHAVDSMKVIVGKAEDATPMMAATLRFASVNPYWNVPPDLVAKLIAPRMLSGGVTYLSERRYEVLDGWHNDAKVIGAETVDWNVVAKGGREARVRQLPGGANSMGTIKFMMPNEYGIYLHDTPNKALFAEENRWLSNGCVRLEDAERLARWVFGTMPRASRPDVEEHVPVQHALPVYLTYLTVGAGEDGPSFRADPYNRDKLVLERFAKAGDGMEDSKQRFEIDLSNLSEPVANNIAPGEPALAPAAGMRKPNKPVIASLKPSARAQGPAAKATPVLKKEPVQGAPLAASSATAKRKPSAAIDELAPRMVTPKAKAAPGRSVTARPKAAD